MCDIWVDASPLSASKRDEFSHPTTPCRVVRRSSLCHHYDVDVLSLALLPSKEDLRSSFSFSGDSADFGDSFERICTEVILQTSDTLVVLRFSYDVTTTVVTCCYVMLRHICMSFLAIIDLTYLIR